MAGSIPRFYMEKRKHKAESRKQGRDVYRNVEYVEIVIPGDRNSNVRTKVTDVHRQRWPDKYKAFVENREDVPDGTPLSMWPPMTSNPAEVNRPRPHRLMTSEAVAQPVVQTAREKTRCGIVITTVARYGT